MVGQQIKTKHILKRVKTTIDESKRAAIKKAVLKELAKVGYINKVAVDVYGKIYYLAEAQVRALQVVAAKLANTDKKAYEDFKENVVVYSGRDITHSHHAMYWGNNGFFVHSFQKGFYTAVDDIVENFYDAQEK